LIDSVTDEDPDNCNHKIATDTGQEGAQSNTLASSHASIDVFLIIRNYIQQQYDVYDLLRGLTSDQCMTEYFPGWFAQQHKYFVMIKCKSLRQSVTGSHPNE